MKPRVFMGKKSSTSRVYRFSGTYNGEWVFDLKDKYVNKFSTPRKHNAVIVDACYSYSGILKKDAPWKISVALAVKTTKPGEVCVYSDLVLWCVEDRWLHLNRDKIETVKDLVRELCQV